MIGIIGGGLAAAKVVEGYRQHRGGTEAITIWSQDPHGPYHRPPLSKRLLRGRQSRPSALVHPLDWYAEQAPSTYASVSAFGSLDDVDAGTIVIATGARPRALDGASRCGRFDDSLEAARGRRGAQRSLRGRRRLHRPAK